MRDIITYLQKVDTWKIQIMIAIDFRSSEHVDEERVMHSKNDSTEFMSCDNVNEVVDELFESLLLRYQISLKSLMTRSGFIFNSGQFLYYKCHKVTFKLGGSYVDSPRLDKKNINKSKKMMIINVFNMR